jgi:hypothetical protein
MKSPLEWQGEDVILQLHVQPGAKQSAFAGLHGDAIKIRVAAQAQEGAANRALCRFLAEAFSVPLSAVIMLNGESSRSKRVRISHPIALPAELAAWQEK